MAKFELFPFFVLMEQNIAKPEGSYISYFSNLVKEKGGINLAQGIPGYQPPQELINHLQGILNGNVHQYAPGVGNFKLRNLLYENYTRNYAVDQENFLIVQGATEAISLIFTYLNGFLKEDFTTLSFEPAYESYSQLPTIFGKKYIDFPLNSSYSVDFDNLESVIKKQNVKIIFVASPGNPFGKVWSESEVNKLVELANKLNFYLIFDGVYKDLYFENSPFLPLAANSPNVFYVNSFSKMLCITGWRVGYLYAHETHRKGLRAIHDYIGLCAPSLLQEALALYLAEHNFGSEFVAQFRENVKQNFSNLTKVLHSLEFSIPKIEGGCFIWAKLPHKFPDGFLFSNQLYQQKGVAVIPGEHFSKNHSNWIRINIARPFDEINQGANLLSEFILKR